MGSVSVTLSPHLQAGLLASLIFIGLAYLEVSGHSEIEDGIHQILLSVLFLLSAANLGVILFLWPGG